MPLQATSGAASYDGFGGGVAAVPTYIEEVFSTWLYTGNDTTQTITNGIDLAGKGGLVWTKSRIEDGNFHSLFDTNRGTLIRLVTSTTFANTSIANSLQSFNSNGFSVGSSGTVNASIYNYVSWTFRKQPKFFDVVTYTGTGSNTTIAHALGAVPGCIIVKRTDTTADWQVYHRSNANTEYLVLNSTAAKATGATRWNSTTPTSTVFSLGTDATVNASGGTYVAYIFAHDAGGFGLTGTDNVISCGSFTMVSNVATVSLGYEPQWTMIKRTDSTDDWRINDVMRGSPTAGGQNKTLYPNSASEETAGTSGTHPTATGFTVQGLADGTYIYIAIRRGPMKVPELGTTVFSPISSSASAGTQLTTNFPVDLQMYGILNGDANNITTSDRLRGVSTTNTAGGNFIVTSSTAAETGGSYTRNFGSTGFVMPVALGDTPGVFWNFRRAPGFFDEVCYTGTGSATTFSHNLAAVPELMMVKKRSATDDWAVYAGDNTDFLLLNTTAATADDNTYWNDTNPTSTVFSVGTNANVNTSAATYVAYLFATCAGVSKVGSYTGTATTQTINCGFTAGARFVLIKRTDSTGDWYVWDTARGIIAGNDPYLLLNSTAAEVTSTDYIDTASTGFEISSTAPAAINANGGSFIFLAIA